MTAQIRLTEEEVSEAVQLWLRTSRSLPTAVVSSFQYDQEDTPQDPYVADVKFDDSSAAPHSGGTDGA